MTYLLLLLALIGLAAFFLNRRKAQRPPSIPATPTRPSAEPRDFLTLAQQYLTTPRPLREMLSDDRGYVLSKLHDILRTGGTCERKYAAFALGQIGDASSAQPLAHALDHEDVSGVRDAIAASLEAVRAIPADGGSTELDRRHRIENVYRSS